MFEFTYQKPFATINGETYEVYYFEKSAENVVTMLLRNAEYNWGTSAVENETTINGVLQTSVNMILQTLSA